MTTYKIISSAADLTNGANHAFANSNATSVLISSVYIYCRYSSGFYQSSPPNAAAILSVSSNETANITNIWAGSLSALGTVQLTSPIILAPGDTLSLLVDMNQMGDAYDITAFGAVL